MRRRIEHTLVRLTRAEDGAVVRTLVEDCESLAEANQRKRQLSGQKIVVLPTHLWHECSEADWAKRERYFS